VTAVLCLARIRRGHVVGVHSFAAALTLAGLVMMLAQCFLTAFLPRFTLPMWELTIVATTLLLGSAAESLRPRVAN
jgi:hypothetical protein